MRDLKAALFFLSEAEDGADYIDDYLNWHVFEHMPEQFLAENIFWGQRFVATPACIEASAVRTSEVGKAQHLQNYIFEDPDLAWKEIHDIGHTLRGRGRDRPGAAPTMRFFGTVLLARTYAAARTMLSPEAIAFRPNHGIYLIVESEPQGLCALEIGEIHDQRQIVVKSLDSDFGTIAGISAATILGDGKIALILDTDEISRGAAPQSLDTLSLIQNADFQDV